MKSSNYRLLKSFLLILGSSILIYLFSFATAVNQEKDTPEIIKTAIFMELTRTNASVVGSDQQRLLVRSYTDLKTYLKQHGWIWTDQLGAMLIFHKSERRLFSNCRMYSRNYMICNLNQAP